MEIKISTNQILKILYVISWIIFIGVSIEAGGFLSNTFYTLVLNPVGAKYFWNHLDLSSLYDFDRGHFFAETTFINIAAVLRAIMFYIIVKFLHDKKLDLSKPFNFELRRFVLNIGYLALGISLFSLWGASYTEWLMNKGVKMPALQYLRLAGADVWLFMSVTMFVIAQIFKRGIEIQSENDLTV
jgi:hypothetical protein